MKNLASSHSAHCDLSVQSCAQNILKKRRSLLSHLSIHSYFLTATARLNISNYFLYNQIWDFSTYLKYRYYKWALHKKFRDTWKVFVTCGKFNIFFLNKPFLSLSLLLDLKTKQTLGLTSKSNGSMPRIHIIIIRPCRVRDTSLF